MLMLQILANNESGDTLICFTNDKSFGGKNVQISQNHQFSSLIPQFNAITLVNQQMLLLM